MTRLEAWGQNYNINYPEDVLTLRALIPELKNISDFQIETMYSQWSEETRAASWYVLYDEAVIQFRDWLLEEDEGEILW